MPATQVITESLIRENIHRAIADVLKTMLGRDCEITTAATQGTLPASQIRGTDEASSPQVVGTVGFIGDINGLIYLYFPLRFAEICTGQLLGLDEAELAQSSDEIVNDAIGELTNMSVGSFKNKLCDAGYPCMLTIPSILRGANFCVEPISSAQRYIYSFDSNGHRIVADILVKCVD